MESSSITRHENHQLAESTSRETFLRAASHIPLVFTVRQDLIRDVQVSERMRPCHYPPSDNSKSHILHIDDIANVILDSIRPFL